MLDREQFGLNLRLARQRAQLLYIKDFTRHLNLSGLNYSESAVQSWETGKRIPNRSTLLEICQLIDVLNGFDNSQQIKDLFSFAEYSHPTPDEFNNYLKNVSLIEKSTLQLPPKPDYRQLHGRSQVIREIINVLSDAHAKQIVVISGLGGIGKTSLAYEVLLIILKQGLFESVAWAVAKQEEFIGVSAQNVANPATIQAVLAMLANNMGLEDLIYQPLPILQSYLKTTVQDRSILLYVDNLETLAAHDFARVLYDLVRDAPQARVLITSRESLAELPFVYDIPIKGLSEIDSLALLKDEARDRRATELLKVDENLLKRIYQVTQGMPLALKLIVTQFLLSIPVEQELKRLEETTAEEGFYHFLYGTVWHKLSDDARTMLLAVAGYPGWTLRSLIQPLVEMNNLQFDQTIAELIRTSLIYHGFHQHASQQMYDIHAITRWFINGPLTDQWLGES